MSNWYDKPALLKRLKANVTPSYSPDYHLRRSSLGHGKCKSHLFTVQLSPQLYFHPIKNALLLARRLKTDGIGHHLFPGSDDSTAAGQDVRLSTVLRTNGSYLSRL